MPYRQRGQGGDTGCPALRWTRALVRRRSEQQALSVRRWKVPGRMLRGQAATAVQGLRSRHVHRGERRGALRVVPARAIHLRYRRGAHTLPRMPQRASSTGCVAAWPRRLPSWAACVRLLRRGALPRRTYRGQRGWRASRRGFARAGQLAVRTLRGRALPAEGGRGCVREVPSRQVDRGLSGCLGPTRPL